MGTMEAGALPLLFSIKKQVGRRMGIHDAVPCLLFLSLLIKGFLQRVVFPKKMKKIFSFMLWKFFFVVYYNQ